MFKFCHSITVLSNAACTKILSHFNLTGLIVKYGKTYLGILRNSTFSGPGTEGKLDIAENNAVSLMSLAAYIQATY